MAIDLTFHLSAQMEDSTTKDSTDSTGNWNEYDVVSRSGDIQFTAILASGTDEAEGESYTFNDFVERVGNDIISWSLLMVSGDNNRTIGKTVCTGQGKLSNLQVSAQNRQKATFSGTLNIYGAVAVGND